MPSLAPSPKSRARVRSVAFLAGALALGLPLLGTGCLEANAAQPDGGSGGEGGHSSSAPTSSSSSSTGPVDATSPVDSTVGTGDGSKREAATGATIPSCTSPTAAQSACATCVETSCSSLVEPAVSACGPFYACFGACACSDANCVNACGSQATGGCSSPLTSLLDCEKSMCATACGLGSAEGGTVPEAGSAGDASSGGTCKNPTATQKACGACEESMCASTVTAEKSACVTFDQCFAACDCSNTSCIDTCAEAAPSACDTQLEALQSCQTGACKSACTASATDGGSTAKDASSSGGTIPNCKNPTSTEQSTYTACSACDVSSCDSYVTAAVSACSAYYACYAATDCSNTSALSTCETSDITTGCQTAIDTLATCQGTFCSFPCSGF